MLARCDNYKFEVGGNGNEKDIELTAVQGYAEIEICAGIFHLATPI